MNTGALILAARTLAVRGSEADGDTEIDDYLAAVDALAPLAADKALCRLHVAAKLREDAAGLLEVSEGIAWRAKCLLKEADRVDAGTLELVAATQEVQGTDRVKLATGGWVKAAVGKGAGSVVVDDATLLPDSLLHPAKPREPDKRAIGELIKSGVAVPGARLHKDESLKLTSSK